jgi:hypothetical protein
MTPPATSPPLPRFDYFPRVTADPLNSWERIGSLARLAPSPYNTQPFRIAPTDAVHARLVILPARMLPREDVGNLYLASAFGIFTAALHRAAAACGYQLLIAPQDAIDVATLHTQSKPVLLGNAFIASTCPPVPNEDLLRARRTSRLPYHPTAIPAAAIAALQAAVERFGHELIVRSDPAFVHDILRLNTDAIVDNLQNDDSREETHAWSRFGETPEFGDGLWPAPMNQPAWQLRAAFQLPGFFTWPGVRQLAIAGYLRTQRGTRHVALLAGPFSAWRELMTAGEMLFDLWMQMSAAGVYMQPMGSMLTNPAYAARIAEAFGKPGWLVFRLGYSDPPPPSPRLQSIIMRDHTDR